MNHIIEVEKKTQIVDECDVLIAGGGIAGIAATLASARNGVKTILIEKQCVLGGLATLGLVTVYLPLCDGMGNQVIYGIGEELLRLSIKYGYGDRYPNAWLDKKSVEERKKQRFMVQYNPHLFALAVEELLIDSGVKILYNTLICDVQIEKENAKISAVIVENNEGRFAIKTGAVVDSTGDANICKLAGINTEIYKKGNPLAAWYYYTSKAQIKLKQFGSADVPTEEVIACNHAPLSDIRYTGLSMLDTSNMLISSHKAILSDVLENRINDITYMPVSIPAIPQVRMTRRIIGEYQMNKNDVFTNFDDSVGLTGDWRTRGPVYEIPFRSLYTKAMRNLITAGRCISVTDTMWDITRAIPTCAVTGEAAGTAAAISCNFANINMNKLQSQLQNQGVKLHY
jgi:ribulose 1,5-bisphosphate synthetase/thiazole synthase